jgi:glycosyltransferase involved in cell wall biosynthesis
VALFAHAPDLGGAGRVLWELADELGRRGVRVHAAAPAEGPLLARMRESGIATDAIDYAPWTTRRAGLRRRLRRWSRNRRALGELVALLERVRPDAVLSNTLTIPAPALAARRIGIPHLWFVHEFGARDHGLRFDLGRGPSLRLVGRLSRRVLVNSQATFQEMARWVDPARLRRIHYAVDVPAVGPDERPPDALPFRLVLVGRLTPAKGQREAVEALALLRARGCDVTLDLVGPQQLRFARELEALGTRHGVRDRLRIVSERSDVAAVFRGADLALMCSRAEALGRVTVEAMKLDRPVVGARCGATPELIEHGSTGLLYRPGSPSDLALQIERLYRDRALARRLGLQAGRWARETFTRERLARELLAALAECEAPADSAVRSGVAA